MAQKLFDDAASINPYLSGAEFHESYTVPFNRQDEVANRSKIIVGHCAGKRIIHVGCCDHVPLVADKILERSWLHGQISEAASFVVGIDINADSVRETTAISGLKNMICGDVTSEQKLPELIDSQFDLVVFGEVLEHIGDPVRFLRRFVENYGKNCGEILITVPNALRGGNVLNIIRNRERINSDHRFFFTPYTIMKVAQDAGIDTVSIEMATFSETQGFFKKKLLNRYSLLAEDIVFLGTVH